MSATNNGWIALAIAVAVGSASAADLHGLKVGEYPNAAKLAAVGITNCVPPQKSCDGAIDWLPDTPVKTAVVFDKVGRVQKIIVTFQSPFFDAIATERIAAWGKPTRSGSARMQNAFGAQVTAIEHDWLLDEGKASILNYAAELTHGQLILETP